MKLHEYYKVKILTVDKNGHEIKYKTQTKTINQSIQFIKKFISERSLNKPEYQKIKNLFDK